MKLILVRPAIISIIALALLIPSVGAQSSQGRSSTTNTIVLGSDGKIVINQQSETSFQFSLISTTAMATGRMDLTESSASLIIEEAGRTSSMSLRLSDGDQANVRLSCGKASVEYLFQLPLRGQSGSNGPSPSKTVIAGNEQGYRTEVGQSKAINALREMLGGTINPGDSMQAYLLSKAARSLSASSPSDQVVLADLEDCFDSADNAYMACATGMRGTIFLCTTIWAMIFVSCLLQA